MPMAARCRRVREAHDQSPPPAPADDHDRGADADQDRNPGRKDGDAVPLDKRSRTLVDQLHTALHAVENRLRLTLDLGRGTPHSMHNAWSRCFTDPAAF